MRSFLVHATRINPTDTPPCDSAQLAAINRASTTYPHSRQPFGFQDEMCVTLSDVKSHFPCLTGDSSPGMPWFKLGLTKALVLAKHGDLIAEAVLDRLNVLSSNDVSSWTAREMIDRFACDPVRLFIKNEPHPKEKLDEGRYRLIGSCSIVDELVTRVLFSRQSNEEIDNWATCPSKPGMGLSSDEQIKTLWSNVLPWISNAKSTDVSGWDWNVKPWLLNLCLRTHWELTDATPCFKRVSQNWLHAYADSVYSTSDGRMMRLKYKGVVKTGSYVTASWNSRMRVLLAYLLKVDNVIAMGDDGVEDAPLSIVDGYRSLGLRIKEVAEFDGESFSFCSHTFRDGRAFPENPYKTLYRLLQQDLTNPTFLEQFKTEMRHSPDLPKLLGIVESSM